MNTTTLLFSSAVIPFLAIAVLGPLIHKKKYFWVGAIATAIFAINTYLLIERYGATSASLRSLLVAVTAVACGWAFHRFQLSKNDQSGH